jgi:hypothetical protein
MTFIRVSRITASASRKRDTFAWMSRIAFRRLRLGRAGNRMTFPRISGITATWSGIRRSHKRVTFSRIFGVAFRRSRSWSGRLRFRRLRSWLWNRSWWNGSWSHVIWSRNWPPLNRMRSYSSLDINWDAGKDNAK